MLLNDASDLSQPSLPKYQVVTHSLATDEVRTKNSVSVLARHVDEITSQIVKIIENYISLITDGKLLS